MARVCLNMIVKNESEIIERCLASVASFIDCYVIVDTGSTDDTKEKIAAFFDARQIPGFIGTAPFENFEQARNAALDAADGSALEFDYLLLTDADMELVVSAPDLKDRLTHNCYLVKQRAFDGLLYDNARLVKRGAGARYVGVTHEYVDCPSEIGRLPEHVFRFIDHACGSNRKDKVARDIALLKGDLERNPDNGRSHFYLAQSYLDAGEIKKARKHYRKRQTLGGFDEEVWFAQMCEAICELRLQNEAEFEVKMLHAFQARPTRAEPLYHLAKYYQSKGQNDLAAMVCDEGMSIPMPNDILFVDTAVYERGFREIFAISGFYARDRKARAFEMNNWLALSRRSSPQGAALASVNMPPYLAPLSVYFDSWQAQKINFAPEPGWLAMNPSIARVDGDLACIVRTVNYEVQFGECGAAYVTPDNAPIMTRNFYVCLGEDLSVVAAHEILPPADMPPPEFDGIRGFEDLRLIEWNGETYVNGTCCELEEGGWRNMIRARIDRDAWRLEELAVLLPDTTPRQAEKNWAPFVVGGELRYVYSCGPTKVVNAEADTVSVNEPAIRAVTFRGGSQLVPFEDGWLCCIHEVALTPGTQRRVYFHRFVWFDADLNLRRVSIPFVFNKPRFEFCAGLAWAKDGEKLIVSYGVDDREAWLGTFDAAELSNFLVDVTSF
jgi:tetratricopeptide (TPR) repeat protein/predicted GH43/DUF377 family glycosyl hydrolase